MYANKEANGIDWGKQLENIKSPFTGLGTDKQGNTNFNYLGAALLGGGTGLVTWALARLLGLKSGPSLTAGLLGALATSYYAFGKQKYGEGWNPFSAEQGKGLFANAGNQIKNTIDQKRSERIQKNLPTDRQKMVQQQQVAQGTATLDPKTKQAVTNETPVVKTNYGSDIWTNPKYLNNRPPVLNPNGEKSEFYLSNPSRDSERVRAQARRLRAYKESGNYDTFGGYYDTPNGSTVWGFEAKPKQTPQQNPKPTAQTPSVTK
jgi:hypothetical protein